MDRKIITAVATEPISTTEVKAQLRITNTDEDTLLAMLITTAREYCEGITRRALATQTIELMLDDFPSAGYIELPCPPLQSVTSIKYTDSAGVESTMSASDYIVDADSNIGKVVLGYNKSWPSFTPYPVNAVRIRYVAGYYASNLIPKILKQAMLLLVGHWHKNREATGTVSGDIEFAFNSLLTFFKAGWF